MNVPEEHKHVSIDNAHDDLPSQTLHGNATKSVSGSDIGLVKVAAQEKNDEIKERPRKIQKSSAHSIETVNYQMRDVMMDYTGLFHCLSRLDS